MSDENDKKIFNYFYINLHLILFNYIQIKLSKIVI